MPRTQDAVYISKDCVRLKIAWYGCGYTNWYSHQSLGQNRQASPLPISGHKTFRFSTVLKKLSHAALSEEHPFLDIECVRPSLFIRSIHPGHPLSECTVDGGVTNTWIRLVHALNPQENGNLASCEWDCIPYSHVSLLYQPFFVHASDKCRFARVSQPSDYCRHKSQPLILLQHTFFLFLLIYLVPLFRVV